MILKHLDAIPIVQTSHCCGIKKVLAANEETVSAITQIAETILQKGDVVEIHSHATMEEFFYILSGELEIYAESKVIYCTKGDFIIISPCEKHSLKALSECKIFTIGCAICY